MTDTKGNEGDTDEKTEAKRNNKEAQYHLEVFPGDVADTVLLPGDTERIEKVTGLWDEYEMIAEHREFRTATGTYDGEEMSVTSTGIGSPSAAIAVEELASVGAQNLIRVGSCGAIHPDVSIGDLIISDGAVRLEGTSGEYAMQGYPAAADYEVVLALVTAAERLGYEYHVGKTATTDSFYVGQERKGFGGYLPMEKEGIVEELRRFGVLNFEMEASAVMTVSDIYNLRSGAICTVYADRDEGEFQVEGEKRASEVATVAAAVLARMDRRSNEGGTGGWTADLSID